MLLLILLVLYYYIQMEANHGGGVQALSALRGADP
jgi:hypothetical protein